MKNISNFIGIDAGIRYNNESGTTYAVREQDGVTETSPYKMGYADLLVGLSNTVKYSLNNKLYVAATGRILFDTKNLTASTFAQAINDSHLGLQLGVGYNF